MISNTSIPGYRKIPARIDGDCNDLSNPIVLQRCQEMAHIGNWILNFSTKKCMVSDECLRIFGFAPNLVPDLRLILKCLLPESRKEILDVLRKALLTGHSQNFEVQFQKKNTDVKRTLVLNAEILFDADENPYAFHGTCKDITETKKAEIALWEYGELYRTILNASPDNITITDTHGRILMVSPMALVMFQCSEEDLLGHLIFEFIQDENSENNRNEKRSDLKLFEKLSKSMGRFQGIRRDGSVFELETHGKPIVGEDSQTAQMVFVIRDISQRLQDELEIRRTNEQLRILSVAIEQSPVTTVITGLDGNIEFVNPKFTDITGYTPEEVLGKNPRVLKNPAKPGSEYKELWDTILSGKNWHGVFHNQKKNGELYWESAVISPVRDQDGVIKHFLAIKEDITDRKLAEEKIKNLLDEKELILREVHHRIKNNMNTIYGLLILQANTVKGSGSALALEDAANRVRSMMLLYTKLYQTASINEISVAQYLPYLIDEIIRNFPNSASIEVVKKIDDFILPVRKLQPLGIIINELLTNIMKYAFEGRESGLITISVIKKDNLVRVIIEDNGKGMPESVSFEQSTGFGLVLVSGLIKQIEGTIQIIREKGTQIVMEFGF